MSTHNILVLEGDGIGPEVTQQAIAVMQTLANRNDMTLNLEYAPFGGAAIDDCGEPVTQATLELAKAADGVLLGAVGGPKWDDLATAKRPEKGLLGLRSELELFANLRPVKPFPALAGASSLRAEVLAGVDFVVVRELVGGIYFGKPRDLVTANGVRRGHNTMVYDETEIRRIGKVAFELAKLRGKGLQSADKANVLEVQALWRDVISEQAASDYPSVSVTHYYVDNCAMQLIIRPSQFDVLVTGNLFGDILSDAAAALTGSLGMLPSASLGNSGGVFEPVHGSAPDIAGQGKANPLAAILSAAMLLEHSLARPDLARCVERAVAGVLAAGLRTGDLVGTGLPAGGQLVGTAQMAQAVIERL